MKRVTGIGGIFLRSENPTALYAWYEKHLGIKRDDPSAIIFHWRDAPNEGADGMTLLSLFPKATKYFGDSGQECMLNLRVDNLDTLVTALEAEGVKVHPRPEDSEYGRFAWIDDPEGHRIELWEPPKTS